MNDLLLSLGITGWKPLLTALLLPPVPWIALILAATFFMPRRRGVAGLLVGLSCAGLWLGGCIGVGEWLTRVLLQPPPALSAADVTALRQQVASRPGRTAIVVLGGGREQFAPEYGVANLPPRAMQRLRYGVWLSRATGAPLAFSGGVGHGGQGEASEAEVAARIAAREFSHPLKWTETHSRDTRENAALTVALLRPQGITHLVVVTDGWHMPRSVRAFRLAAEQGEGRLEITAAPMGMGRTVDHPALRWMPSNEGLQRVRDVVREWLGRLAGA